MKGWYIVADMIRRFDVSYVDDRERKLTSVSIFESSIRNKYAKNSGQIWFGEKRIQERWTAGSQKGKLDLAQDVKETGSL